MAYVTGIQGPDPDAPINIATPKHFAVHSGPEPTRHVADVKVSLHDLRDTYLPAFRAAVVEGKAGAVMCSYNEVNGQPACANDFLFKTTLRGAWDFKGQIVSDCEAVSNIWETHRYAKDAPGAYAAAVHAGLDMICTADGFFDPKSFGASDNIVRAVRTGQLSVADLDRAVVKTLAVRIRTGGFDRAAAAPSARSVVNTPEHRALALKAAEESLILLKNDGLLPLRRTQLKVAVVGPLADSRHGLRGNYNSRETSTLPSIFDGIREALPGADVRLVAAGASLTDGDVVPASALQNENGGPGVTVRYFASLAPSAPAPKSLTDKITRFMTAGFAAEPLSTETLPLVNFETPTPGPLPNGGRIVATGYLVPPESGTYRLGVLGGGNELRFDGKPFVTSPLTNDLLVRPVLGTIKLEANKRYPISMSILSPGIRFGQLVWQRVSPTPDADLAAAARDADVVIAVVGIDPTLETEEATQDLPGFKGGDRTSLDLPADQIRLLAVAKATGKPLVVVNSSGSAINLEWAKRNATAILQVFYPGEAGGAAVGRVVAGLANPAGRLPVTFYRDVSQLPPFDDYAMKGRTYRYFRGVPVFPFGYGLSYTSFAYGPVTVRRSGASAADGVVVETDLTNTGARSGDEVAQLYLDFPKAPGVPDIALRGFQRVTLAAGETRRLRFSLTPRDLSSVSPEGAIRVLRGAYSFHVGGGLPNSGLPSANASIAVDETIPLPD
ncbi:beta-glucosidase [Sphingomonas sp. PvP018]|nr:beta-glucosidase [Sphingomonas sp. PvP018]